MPYRLRFLLAFLVLVIPANALAQDDWSFSLHGDYLYGDVDGYIQTPSGGEPGTTSLHRPTLEEIGISNASIYDAQVTAARNDNELYLGGQWIRMSGSATLDQTLISRGQTFLAGERVTADVDLDWYRVGYRRRFTFGRDWTLWPSAGAAILDFHYQLRGASENADRSYIKENAQFGIEVEWRPRGGAFALDLNLLDSPPLSPSLPQMNVEALLATYRIFEHNHSDLELQSGVAFEQIDFEDNQDTPNRIHADFGPLFIFGLAWRF